MIIFATNTLCDRIYIFSIKEIDTSYKKNLNDSILTICIPWCIPQVFVWKYTEASFDIEKFFEYLLFSCSRIEVSREKHIS